MMGDLPEGDCCSVLAPIWAAIAEEVDCHQVGDECQCEILPAPVPPVPGDDVSVCDDLEVVGVLWVEDGAADQCVYSCDPVGVTCKGACCPSSSPKITGELKRRFYLPYEQTVLLQKYNCVAAIAWAATHEDFDVPNQCKTQCDPGEAPECCEAKVAAIDLLADGKALEALDVLANGCACKDNPDTAIDEAVCCNKAMAGEFPPECAGAGGAIPAGGVAGPGDVGDPFTGETTLSGVTGDCTGTVAEMEDYVGDSKDPIAGTSTYGPQTWVGSKFTLTFNSKILNNAGIVNKDKTMTTMDTSGFTVEVIQTAGSNPVQVMSGNFAQPKDKLSGIKSLGVTSVKSLESGELIKIEAKTPYGPWAVEALLKDADGQVLATCRAGGEGIQELQSGGGLFGCSLQPQWLDPSMNR